MEKLIGIIGIFLLLLIAFALSNNKKAINYKTVGVGFALQVLFGIFIFKVPLGQKIFLWLGEAIVKLLEFANVGGKFTFGPLMDESQMQGIFNTPVPFAIQLLSATIFMMMIVNILYYYGIMQRVVTVLGKAMNKIMKVSGAEALSNVASAFVGQITAQMMIKPYLAK